MLAEIGLMPLLPTTLPIYMGQSTTYSSIGASTHWAGGQFFAGVTDTITAIRFVTGTVTSPQFQLEAAITALDSNGYPLGADVAVSTTTVTNPTANTDYSLTISASVTKGTLYGIILRVKSGTYTSGSANVGQRSTFWYRAGVSGGSGYPCASSNSGSNGKFTEAWSLLMPKYSSAGWYETVGCIPVSAAGTSNLSITATSGYAAGNKFTLNHNIKVIGYLFGGDVDNAANVEMYSGSDNTAMTGSSVSLTAGYRASTSMCAHYVMLANPVILTPGTYRVGIRNTSATANVIGQMASFPEAGMGALLSASAVGLQKTVYTGSWTDTNTAICAITPVVSHIDDGRPHPIYQIGI